MSCAIGIVVDGEGFAPIALAAEDGITQAVVRLDLPQTFGGDVRLHLSDGIGDRETCDDSRVDEGATLAVLRFIPGSRVSSFFTFGDYHLNNRQVKVTSKGKVTAVVCRYGHHRSSAIASQDIVADPDGDGLTRQRIGGVGA